MTLAPAICHECGEPARRGYLLCDGCCGHDDVDTSDEADGREGGRPHEWVSRCEGCGAEMEAVQNEDGWTWEVAR